MTLTFKRFEQGIGGLPRRVKNRPARAISLALPVGMRYEIRLQEQRLAGQGYQNIAIAG
jgi:hypothetical protein